MQRCGDFDRHFNSSNEKKSSYGDVTTTIVGHNVLGKFFVDIHTSKFYNIVEYFLFYH